MVQQYSKENGFPSNCVTEIEEDSKGNIWFGFRIAEKNDPNIKKQKSKGGIAKINGKKLNLFSEIKKLSNSEVYEIYKDKHSNIWIATTKNGVYKYNGDKFINYPIPISIMSITQDNKENFWLGGAGGLYKINSKGIIYWKTNIKRDQRKNRFLYCIQSSSNFIENQNQSQKYHKSSNLLHDKYSRHYNNSNYLACFGIFLNVYI